MRLIVGTNMQSTSTGSGKLPESTTSRPTIEQPISLEGTDMSKDLHPSHQAALQKRLSEKGNIPSRQAMKNELEEILQNNPDINFTYVRTSGESPAQGGLVIAWSYADKNAHNRRMLNISLSWCREDEMFDKLIGRYYAAKAFASGAHTLFRTLYACNYSAQLKAHFSPCVLGVDEDDDFLEISPINSQSTLQGNLRVVNHLDNEEDED